MDENIGWELYRTFLAVLEEGSLSGAARALGITQPTAGRHVATLEQHFGQALFTRSQTGLLPTDTALALRAHAQAMHSNAAALARAATAVVGQVAGTVRISASEVVAIEVLPPILRDLRQRHPQLKIELVPSNQVQDLLQRQADIAVRMAQPSQEALLARHVGAIEVGLYAHRDYLEAHGTPQELAQLAPHALIGFDRVTPFLRTASQQFPVLTREAFSWRSDSDVAQLALLRAGCGIGACQVALAARDANLVRILAPQFSFSLPTWITMHEGLRGSARCKIVFDALAQGLLAYIEGSGCNAV